MDIEIETFVAPAKVNPFTPLVEKLAKAGEGHIGRFAVPEGMKPSVAKVKFAQAAREAGHSARLQSEEQGKDGKVTLAYILGAKRTRKSAKDGNVVVVATDDTAKG